MDVVRWLILLAVSCCWHEDRSNAAMRPLACASERICRAESSDKGSIYCAHWCQSRAPIPIRYRVHFLHITRRRSGLDLATKKSAVEMAFVAIGRLDLQSAHKVHVDGMNARFFV